MVNFRITKRLDFKNFRKNAATKIGKSNGNGKEQIPLSVQLPESTKSPQPKRPAWLRTLGNLLLIAVGVFLALIAGQWWSHRGASTEALVYIENFQRDIQEDIKRLKNSIDINSSRILDVKEILGDLYRNPDSVNLNSFYNRYLAALYVSKFTPTHPTFNDFVSRNQRGILDDVQLRNDIFRYYDNVEKAIDQIESYELHHNETFVPTFNAEYIKARTLIIFKKYYENIDEENDPDLSFWKMSKDSPQFIKAENLLLQRLLYLDRSLEIEKSLLLKAQNVYSILKEKHTILTE